MRTLHVIESQTETDTDSDEFDSHVVSTMTLTPQKEEVNAVRNSTTYERKLYAVIKIGRKLVKFQIDAGATCSVLKQSDLPQKHNDKADSASTCVLQRNKDEAPCVEDCESDKPSTSKRYSVEFIVVKDAATSILGAAASQTRDLLKVQFKKT